MDIFLGGVADLEILDYAPDITDNLKAVKVIAELIDKLAEKKAVIEQKDKSDKEVPEKGTEINQSGRYK